MASAAPQKRMVSSVFITLASPYRATVTQQQHARQTHDALAGDIQHTAVQVHPGGSDTLTHRKGSTATEARGGSAQKQLETATFPKVRLSVSPRPSAPSLWDPDSVPVTEAGPEDAEPGKDTPRTTSEELFPPPPPPPVFVDTNHLTQGASPLPPPPILEPSLTAPLNGRIPDQTPAPNKQGRTVEPETRSPCRVEDPNELLGALEGPLEPGMESREVCGFCRKPVALSDPAIDALNRTYHDSCFQCRQCRIPLAGKLYYNNAGIPLCEDCYQTSLELCWVCGEVIKDHVIRALERAYHPACFTCATCSQPIGEQRFAQGEVGEVYCLQDYYRKYAPECSACQQLIIPREDGTDSYTVECLGRSFHEDCYRCEVCITQLSPEPNDHGCYPLDGKVLCKSCHLTLVQSGPL
ncbi:filamin-binding LIM protein 1 [Hypomesus transpacificus]|uniref:filamin-binding LIM protein 1 n=1 Tax=Hypomesus transpacificus TaxID=137520 RepID=UPI001F07FE7F|nr:filamin-binding LIM protein 1 [Hypomesus transpacificus]XP_046882302.1 filamin-binding LIM protein 1 [Hypomesus transpacificus]